MFSLPFSLPNFFPRCRWSGISLFLVGFLFLSSAPLRAKDYYVVIGGGPYKEQNQASMEANVLFLQEVVQKRGASNAEMTIYFADGNDPSEDLQVLVPPTEAVNPVTELLQQLHRRGPGGAAKPIGYRNHSLPNVAGATSARRIASEFKKLSEKLRKGDRVFIYVTAHGHAGPKENLQNTTIACWRGTISAEQMMGWLDAFPTDVPVFMFMAQCYAGGFANLIFADLEKRTELSSHPRVGFFAQQHDLPAAGCRPDIEFDQEFSSYFFGSILGQTRNGERIDKGDLDGDGVVTLDEAFAYTVSYGETIDIPLRGSELLLRQFSEIPGYTLFRDRSPRERFRSEEEENVSSPLQSMTGKIEALVDKSSPTQQAIVRHLCEGLEIDFAGECESVFESYRQHERNQMRGFRGRRGGGGSVRRELLTAIFDKWPELNASENWEEAACLKELDQRKWFEEIQQLPEFTNFDRSRTASEEAAANRVNHELKSVKHRRLIEAIETAVLERNLKEVAGSKVYEKYAVLKELERATLK